MSNKSLATRLVHSDRIINKAADGAVHTSTNNSVLFEFDDVSELEAVFQGKKAGHVYSRSSSNSAVALQNLITDFEQGVGAAVFSTGMAAINAVLFSLLKTGDHLIASQYLFGNTRSLLETLANFGVEITYIDVTDAKQLEQSIRSNTVMFFTESIANPGTQVSELKALGQICASNSIVFVLDNTMTPFCMLDAKTINANIITCSLTKYIAGHGNVLGGAAIDLGNFDWREFNNINEAYKFCEYEQWAITQIRKKGLRDMGATLAPQSAHSISIGLETLQMRMAKTCENALRIAEFLNQHSLVKEVLYPGLEQHPQHELAKQLFDNHFGGILSFELDSSVDIRAFINDLTLVIAATHLGDTRTLILPVASTIFYENGPQQRKEMGISDTLVRMSIGIEDCQDVIKDLQNALSRQSV